MGIDIPEFMKTNSRRGKTYYVSFETIQEVRRQYQAMQNRVQMVGFTCAFIGMIIGALISLLFNSWL